jgi:predicted RNase H-like HicB family nuclease
MTVKSIATVKPVFPFEAYSHFVSPIDAADGGGFMFTMPGIPGVAADGATELEAIDDGREAFIATIIALVDMGAGSPGPGFQSRRLHSSICIWQGSGTYSTQHAHATGRQSKKRRRVAQFPATGVYR